MVADFALMERPLDGDCVFFLVITQWQSVEEKDERKSSALTVVLIHQ